VEEHVKIGVKECPMASVHLDGWGAEATTTVTTAWDGTVLRVAPGGGEAKPVLCHHRRGGFDPTVIHPHRTPDEALACARVLAERQWPGVPVVEAETS